jgi:hypothetical protein
MHESIDLFFENEKELASLDFSLDFFETLKNCKSISDAELAKWAEKEKAYAANQEKRKRVLSRPINAEDVETQSKHLHYVPYAGHLCLMYYTKARGGVSGEYGKFKFYTDGEYCWVGAHQFALALKLGNYQIGKCRLSDLFGFDAAHASKALCLGGRCCLPEHLFKRKSEPNRSWDAAKDYSLDGRKGYRTDAQLAKMVARLRLPIQQAPAPLPGFLEII